MNNKLYKMITGTLVVMLGFVAWSTGQSPASAAAKKFSDVGPKQSWALQDITKMSVKRIIEGTPEGQFLPDQAVQQQQALTMVLNAMGYKETVADYDGKDHAASYKGVSDWAKNYISFAHQEGLLDKKEIKGFNGEHAGSREWVAQLMTRMIDKEDEALSKSYKGRTFTDQKDISKWAKPFVELAASKEFDLISGFPNDDGTFSFKPQQNVTRAQLAVLVSRAERFIENPVGNELQGQVLSIGNDWLISTNNGERTVKVAKDTPVFKDYKKLSVPDVKRHQSVYVLYKTGKPDVAEYIEVLDKKVAEEVVTGTITKLIKPKQTMAVTTSNGLNSYQLSKDVKYGSKNNTVKSIDDLNEGDKVELTFVGGQVTKVYQMTEDNAAPAEATIYDIDVAQGLITIELADQSVKVYALDKNVRVQYPDQRTVDVSSLRKGMEVDLKQSNNKITTIKVTRIIEDGNVISISADKTYITLTTSSDKNPKVYTLASSAVIKAQDAVITSNQIQPGDEIVIEIGTDGVIQSLNIKNRGATGGDTSTAAEMIEGKVFSIDTVANTLILEIDRSGQKTYQPYDFSSTYDLYINGKWTNKQADIKKDMRAKIQLYDDEIVYLEVDNRLDGEIIRLDTERRLLTLRHDDGEQVTYYVDGRYDLVIRHLGGADLDDLEQQNRVRVKLNDNDRVIDIAVEKEIAYRVTDITESNKRLQVKRENGSQYNLTLKSGVDLTIPGVRAPKIKDFKKGDIVKTTFLGDELKSVEVLPSQYGKVTHMDPNTNQYTVLKSDGTSVSDTFNLGDVVVSGTNEYTQLSTLAINDRVLVQTWADNEKRITKMDQVSEQFSHSDRDFIYAKDSVRSYRYAPDLVVRGSDNRGITLNSLQQNDRIHLYRHDGIVHEVQKVN